MNNKPKASPGGSWGERVLQEKYGTSDAAEEFYSKQVLEYLNADMQDFVARQEMMFIATADSKGNCDASIRTGPKGFIKIIDEKNMVFPEFRGNGVLASLGNIHENPHMGILLVDFTEHSIGLHVNGNARILENDEILGLPECSEPMRREIQRSSRKHPGVWVWIEVEEAYIHCAKHLPLLKKKDKKIQWGTNRKSLKGGDFFNTQRSKS